MSLRRPAPSLLLTATLATVVVLPLTVDAHPAERRPNAAATRLVQQALPAPAPGVSIREVSQAEPFSMVALTGADLSGTSARVRAKHADGSWGPWYQAGHDVEVLTPRGSDGRARRPAEPDGTDPVFVGTTTAVQIAITRPAENASPATPAAPAPATPPGAPPAHPAPAKPGLGYVPATAERPFAQNISAVLITPPRAPVSAQWTPPAAIISPGQPPNIIPRSQWGAARANRCSRPADNSRVRAAVIHHTAGSTDYSPQESAQIVQSIYAYHTRTLGWCDIGYNALVDKYGQVFEGRAGGITKAIKGDHAGGFNRDTWGVAMVGNFEATPPPPIQVSTVGRLLGWRLNLAGADPLGTTQLASAGGRYTNFKRGTALTLPTIFGHRDVDSTECPGNDGYAVLDQIREIAARFSEPLGPEDLVRSMEGGAIHTRWQELGGMNSMLGAPTSPEAATDSPARYALFERGAMYWSPETGAQPVIGAIYDAWAQQGYEHSALGMPTSAEIEEPEWVGQNFQHGTLNFDRGSGAVTRVVDGVAQQLPPIGPEGPPMQLERFSPVFDPAR